MKTIAENLQQSKFLSGVSDSARLDTEVLLAAVLNKDRTYLYTWPESVLTPAHQHQFDEYMQQRIKGDPIAYIVGEKEFWSLNLWVSNDTLIPRPDTEIIVETALELFVDDVPEQPRSVIDLGTGTGAIALALASEKPAWKIIAVDNNRTVCELAERNRVRHQLDNVSVICSDWLSSITATDVDMIVSNPPYIAENDPHLCQGDVRYEPASALTAKNNGLADIEKIAAQAASILSEHGWIVIEHGYQQGSRVISILESNGYVQCRTIQDLAGQPRATIGQRARNGSHDE
ncbi:peptide chain release factor N(5)-glutamine methyltransferase [Eionea flava]